WALKKKDTILNIASFIISLIALCYVSHLYVVDRSFLLQIRYVSFLIPLLNICVLYYCGVFRIVLPGKATLSAILAETVIRILYMAMALDVAEYITGQ